MRFMDTDTAFETIIKAGREHVRCLENGLASHEKEAMELSLALDVVEDFYVNNVAE
jgi:hypothetical protein